MQTVRDMQAGDRRRLERAASSFAEAQDRARLRYAQDLRALLDKGYSLGDLAGVIGTTRQNLHQIIARAEKEDRESS